MKKSFKRLIAFALALAMTTSGSLIAESGAGTGGNGGDGASSYSWVDSAVNAKISDIIKTLSINKASIYQ